MRLRKYRCWIEGEGGRAEDGYVMARTREQAARLYVRKRGIVGLVIVRVVPESQGRTRAWTYRVRAGSDPAAWWSGGRGR